MKKPSDEMLPLKFRDIKENPITFGTLIFIMGTIVALLGLNYRIMDKIDETANVAVKVHEAKDVDIAHESLQKHYPSKEVLNQKFFSVERKLDAVTQSVETMTKQIHLIIERPRRKR